MATLNTNTRYEIPNQEYINKIDILDLKTNSGITVVDANQEGTTWYRKYSDGWIEQGGRTASLSDGEATVTFPIEFKDTNYSILTTSVNSSANSTTTIAKSLTKKTAVVTYDVEDGSGTGTIQWYACGY